jgi:hypothetical protein
MEAILVFFTFFIEKSFLLLARIEIITNFVHPIREKGLNETLKIEIEFNPLNRN